MITSFLFSIGKLCLLSTMVIGRDKKRTAFSSHMGNYLDTCALLAYSFSWKACCIAACRTEERLGQVSVPIHLAIFATGSDRDFYRGPSVYAILLLVARFAETDCQ